jgi:16S rRNA (cytosine967-C5)-methyltransferase
MKEKLTARKAAYLSLEACRKDGKYPNLEINSALERWELSGAERGLYTALVYGVTERLITLDYIIDHYARGKVEHSTRCALRLGLYQLIYMDRVPDHAAVAESVELVKKAQRGFVNAVLRSFIRDGREIPPLPTDADDAARLSVTYSVGRELAAFWIEHYGTETAERLLSASFDRERMYLLVNTMRITAETAIERLRSEGAAAEKGRIPGMISVDSSPAVYEGIERGDWIVQDEASALAVLALDPHSGDMVIDTCAAPGGKTLSAAIAMNGEGHVCAFDLHKNKLSLITSAAARLGVEKAVDVACRDGRDPDPALIGKADRVLCDVPCSGFGVIGKKPDIKYKPISDAKRLPEVQYAILSASADYVKKGGVLVYSTCTVSPLENDAVTDRFLSEHREFEPCPFSSPFGEHESGRVQLMMHIHGTDGFYVAKMRKTGD